MNQHGCDFQAGTPITSPRANQAQRLLHGMHHPAWLWYQMG